MIWMTASVELIVCTDYYSAKLGLGIIFFFFLLISSNFFQLPNCSILNLPFYCMSKEPTTNCAIWTNTRHVKTENY